MNMHGLEGTPINNFHNSLEETVIRGGFCVGCGACAVPEKSPYKMEFRQGRYFPAKFSPLEAVPTIDAVCPFSDSAINEDDIARKFLINQDFKYDKHVGFFYQMGAMWVSKDEDRLPSSSGGVTTWITKYLLEMKMVDGIIHVQPRIPNTSDPRLFEYAISRTATEIQSGCSSRYYPISMDAVIRLASTSSEKFVFVGIPCFIKALRLLMIDKPDLASRIPYTIGLVCGHLKTAGFAEIFAAQLGVSPNALKAINFRVKMPDCSANKYGVQISYSLLDGQEKITTIPNSYLLGSDWGLSFFRQKSCDFCDDIFAETADLVVGDAWLPQYTSEWRGTSIVLSRNKDLDECLSQGIYSKQIFFEPLTISQMATSQRSNISNRREALPYRLMQYDKKGLWRPKKRFETTLNPISAERIQIIDLRSALAHLTQDTWSRVREIKPVEEAFHAFKIQIEPVLDELQYKHRMYGVTPVSIGQRIVKNLKNLLISGLSCFFKFARKINIQQIKRNRQIILLPPASPGSLGDEAVLVATLAQLKLYGIKHFSFLSYRVDDDWSHLRSNIVNLPVIDYIGYRSTRVAISILLECLFSECLLVCGTDVLDGHHNTERSIGRLAVAELVAQAGVPVTIIGASYSEDADPAARYALRQVKGKLTMCARDPISYEVAQRILQGGVKLVADPAFLLEPVRASIVSDNLTPWIEQHHWENGIVLGFNANHFLAQGNDGEDADAVVNAFSDILLKLAEAKPELAICLIPHDVRGKPSDVDLAKMILDRVNVSLGKRCVMVPEGLTAGEIKDVVSQMDVVFSGKMHLSIAALGSCVPVGCITYKDKKFLGLFNHFGIQEWLLPENAWQNSNLLFDFLLKLINARLDIKSKIANQLPHIIDLAKKNFADIH